MLLTDFLATFDKLSPEELKSIIARANYYLKDYERGTSLNDSVQQRSVELLHEVISERCHAIPNLYIVRTQNPYNEYPALQSTARQITDIAIQFKLDSTQTRQLYKVAVETAIIKLRSKPASVTLRTILNTLGEVGHLLESEYPGYMSDASLFIEFVLCKPIINQGE